VSTECARQIAIAKREYGRKLVLPRAAKESKWPRLGILETRIAQLDSPIFPLCKGRLTVEHWGLDLSRKIQQLDQPRGVLTPWKDPRMPKMTRCPDLLFPARRKWARGPPLHTAAYQRRTQPITALLVLALAKWLATLLMVALPLLMVALPLLVVALPLLVVALPLLVVALTLLVLPLARWLLTTLVVSALAKSLLADLQAQRVVASDATETTPRPTTLQRRWAKPLPQTSADASSLDGVVPLARP
jgi:hypothetical protein